jgi:hypothetical protein
MGVGPFFLFGDRNMRMPEEVAKIQDTEERYKAALEEIHLQEHLPSCRHIGVPLYECTCMGGRYPRDYVAAALAQDRRY